ncbi:PREDICTED: transcription termination factor 1 [Crocodylus porosus]|uniref:Transcription termination factor 1 n=1 Tax=Crocodylus porosus TaxID=8502 RepID=A0A7M4EFS7_CROPO|nr:PREDICTED: transcription termination factor 1 [Crocodylus porosus]
MTEEANTHFLQNCHSVKKRRKKKKRNGEHTESFASDRDKCALSMEACSPPPVLSEDQCSQNSELHKKKKKKNRKENLATSLDDSLILWEDEINNKTVIDASQEKKKQKKQKNKKSSSLHEENSVLYISEDEDNASSLDPLGNVDCVIVPTKTKKRKKSLSEKQDEVKEVCAFDEYASKRQKKKKKRGQTSLSCTQEATDENLASLLLLCAKQNSASLQEVKDKMAKLRSRTAVSRKGYRGGESSNQANSEATEIFFGLKKGPMDIPTAIPTVTSGVDNGSSEEVLVPVRKIKKRRRSSLQQVPSEPEKKLPVSVAFENEEDQNVSLTEYADSEMCMLKDEEFLESMPLDLEAAKQELEEFIPHVRKMSDESILKMAGRDLNRFKKFKNEGVAVKFGRFSKKENNQIQKNVEDFLSLTGLESAEKLLFTYRFPEEKQSITRLKVKYGFCEKIAKRIPRPWRLIYVRARKMFDPNNYKGRYSEDEKEQLKRYHAMHGNNWKKISEMMNRSNLSVALKYSQMKAQINAGPWTKEETQRLIKAVEEIIQERAIKEDSDSLFLENSEETLSVERKNLYRNLPWVDIQTKVGTRHWRQCKAKWLSVLTKKMSNGEALYHGTKGLQAKINLIERLYNMKVEDANEINWEELSSIFGDVPEAYVQGKFSRLKATYVPFWHSKSFPEIIDYLYDETIPLLQKKLEKQQDRFSYENLSSSQQKKLFRISDIFGDSKEEDNDPGGNN